MVKEMWKARFCLIPTSYRQRNRGLNRWINFPNLTQLQNERSGTQGEIHISLLEILLLKSFLKRNYNQSCFLEIFQVRIWELLVNLVLSLFKSQVLVLPHSLLMNSYQINRRNKDSPHLFPLQLFIYIHLHPQTMCSSRFTPNINRSLSIKYWHPRLFNNSSAKTVSIFSCIMISPLLDQPYQHISML